MDNEQIEEIIDVLESAGYDVRKDYSGRGMYGKRCLGVDISHAGELFNLGALVADFGLKTPATDSMGRGVIAYWPSIQTDALLVGSDDEE